MYFLLEHWESHDDVKLVKWIQAKGEEEEQTHFTHSDSESSVSDISETVARNGDDDNTSDDEETTAPINVNNKFALLDNDE